MGTSGREEQEFWVSRVAKECDGGGEAYAEAPSVVAMNAMPRSLVTLVVTELGQSLG